MMPWRDIVTIGFSFVLGFVCGARFIHLRVLASQRQGKDGG